MPLSLTPSNTFYTDSQLTEPNQRVAFNTTGTYCAVGIDDDLGPGSGLSGPTAEVWVYKRTGATWARVGVLVTDGSWSNYEAWRVALADNLTVLSVMNNGTYVHRWKSTGVDTWAADTYWATGFNSVSGVAISSDGNVAIYWDEGGGGCDSKIYTGVSGTVTSRQTFSTVSDYPMGACLSSDGKTLALGRSIGGSDNTVQIWTSTTLGTNSWTLATTIDIPGHNIMGMKMTTDKGIIAVGVDGGGPPYKICILDNTGGTAYTYLGSYYSPANSYNSIFSFGLSDAGVLVVPGYQGYPGQTGRLWSVDNVLAVAGDTVLSDEITNITTTGAYDWVVSADLDPTGSWVCIQGGGEDPTTADTVQFFSVAALPPYFWNHFAQSVEARS